MMESIFIAWTPYHRRSELLAQHFGADLHFIHSGRQGRVFQAPVRYLAQGWRTWQLVCSAKPRLVFVQNPPIFCVLLAFLYARAYRARFVIDSHTGAFVSRRWRWSLPLHRWLSGRAVTTIVHNRCQEAQVRSWGCRHDLVGYTPGDYPPGERYPVSNGFSVAVVSSFSSDEPLSAVMGAAALLPQTSFYITGDPRRADRQLLALKPDNCEFTGYLPSERYVGLLRSVDAIMVLTNRDETLLEGGFEAVSLEVPLITSDWPVLREYFDTGTVHVANNVEGICRGVSEAQLDLTRLQQEMRRLHDRLQAEWERAVADLRPLLLA